MGVEVWQGDLTTLAVDAIVNAANSSLLGGGGVDGAIHRKAGPELVAACRPLGGCKTGDAKITPGFRLPARYVIHTVGPVWRGGGHGEADLLARCYQRSLTLARDLGLEVVAFPGISTGIFRFPLEAAAQIAVREVRAFLAQNPLPRRVILCTYDANATAIMTAALGGEEVGGRVRGER